jgi:16S rRNA (cytosine1402-N4)-methyltransferase
VNDVVTPERRGHVPVMPEACLRELAVMPGQIVCDCTAGGGGHLERFALAVGGGGRVIALDRDDRAFRDDAAGGVARRFSQVTLLRHAFSELPLALGSQGLTTVDVVFADLGVSSFQLDEGERGFSFQQDAPLDMRMDRSRGETAAELIARLDDDELADVIYLYGEERQSRRIARSLKRHAPQTTSQLKDAVVAATGPARGRIHPATKTFQALRIAVNGELDELKALLAVLPDVLKQGGRAGFLTFHSLEDRLVKHAFKAAGFHPTTKKPVIADEAETDENPRSRSAKLRVAVFDPSRPAGKQPRYRKDDHSDDSSDSDDSDDSNDSDEEGAEDRQ